MGLELRTIHLPPSGRLEISGTVNIMNKFTAVQRYALIAGWAWSGTTACPPPEGDWMTSAPRLQATWGIARGGPLTRGILQGCGGPVARGSWFERGRAGALRGTPSGRARAHSRGAPSGPWLPPVDYLKGKF